MRFVPVGRVISTYGVKGEVKFRYYNDEKEVFYGYTSFFIKSENGWIQYKPVEIKLHKGFFLIKLKGLDGPEDASFLINKEFFVREGDLAIPEEGEFYIFQLVGLSVITDDTKEPIGEVKDIMHTGAHDILVVEGEKELLIPMVEKYISEISLEGSYIKIKGISAL